MTENTSSPLDDLEQEKLDDLGRRFMDALALKDVQKLDEAENALRAIISEEPRLAEPQLELARIFLDTDRLTLAEDHAREALENLPKTGVWTAEVPPNTVLAIAHGLMAEILRRLADEDDVIFGDPERFRAILDESKEHFAKAAAADPSDEYASFHAFFLGVPQGQDVD